MIPSFTRMLLIQLGDIGDVVLTSPTIRAVKESRPNANISILVRKPYGSLLLANPAIDEVIEFEKIRGNWLHILRGYTAFAGRLRQAHFDMVVDLRTGDRGAILSFLTGAPLRIGRPGNKNQFWHKILFTQIVRDPLPISPRAHPGADQSLRIMREIGIDTEDTTPRLYIALNDQGSAKKILATAGIVPESGIVTVNPYSRWKYKEWSNEKWGSLLDLIWEAYKIPAVLIGSSQEVAGCQEIVAGREGHTISLAGKTTLGELAAVISMSKLHLGVDSAAPHIAAALGTPTVTIHGPTDWRAWRVVNERHKVISSMMDCVPCNKTGCEGKGQSRCLDELSVEAVWKSTKELLETIDKVNLRAHLAT